jgi:hypothetical protein
MSSTGPQQPLNSLRHGFISHFNPPAISLCLGDGDTNKMNFKKNINLLKRPLHWLRSALLGVEWSTAWEQASH